VKLTQELTDSSHSFLLFMSVRPFLVISTQLFRTILHSSTALERRDVRGVKSLSLIACCCSGGRGGDWRERKRARKRKRRISLLKNVPF
jgi:hypothetical protein